MKRKGARTIGQDENPLWCTGCLKWHMILGLWKDRARLTICPV
jgi:hypothetical protein